jgi:formylglycine-generating enzyme required for sulfatase activity
MPRLLLRLVLATLLLAACGAARTPTPSPIEAAKVTTAPPAPPAETSQPTSSAMPPPSPAPIPTSPGEPATRAPEAGVETAAPAAATSSDASFPALGDTWLRPADGMVMVYVPGGTFPMGSAADDPEAVPDEQPQHTVTLDGFWIDRTEVTNAQFVQFLNEHGNSSPEGVKMIVLDQGYARISQAGDRFITTEAALDRPVVMVTWHGAAAYCGWAGGYLPTEAQWAYAARGPKGNRYPWGDASPNCDLANYGDCNRAAAQVGSRPAGASWCGALDMAGNVWEWVTDRFGPYSGRPRVNPSGPASGDVPVLRGGGWHSPRWEIRAAYRQHELPASGCNG